MKILFPRIRQKLKVILVTYDSFFDNVYTIEVKPKSKPGV